MTFVPQPPSLLPESAPFTPAQRAWLSGFFAGLISIEGSPVTPLSPEESAALMPAGPAESKAASDDGDGSAPWHDQSLPLSERMKLAEGRPLHRRMMAAMAQQDCGQCGYNCQDYSGAIARRAEERLNLCVPGGKETARMLRTLYAEMDKPAVASPPAAEAAAPARIAAKPEAGCSRDHPALVTFLSRQRLNKPGSEKETWHIELDIAEAGIDYAVGDSFGIFPTNDPALVDAVIRALQAPEDFPIGGRMLREVLTDGVSLGAAPDMLFQLYSYITGGTRRLSAKALAGGKDPDGDAESLDVLAAVEKFAGVRPDPEAF